MANEIKTLNQIVTVNETGEQIPAIALVITGSFEKILKFIFVKAKGQYKTAIDIVSDAMQKGSNLLPDEMRFFEEKISADDGSGKQLDAIGILIDEATKNRLDAIMTISNDKNITSHTTVITSAVFRGIDEILKKLV